ncbi:hypothetical protein [Spiroplasma taiwanense]|uniref:hypothetical protein n=1 Tax=Spiroplasma taiwanense TaxID=2145 RepID=UPI0003FA6F41|nr:hypothetical protein [Spiroplasma taiwanense]
MEKLNNKQKREIIGGKGVTGSLLGGIADIVKQTGGFLQICLELYQRQFLQIKWRIKVINLN